MIRARILLFVVAFPLGALVDFVAGVVACGFVAVAVDWGILIVVHGAL